MINASGRPPESEVEDRMRTEGAPHPKRLPDKWTGPGWTGWSGHPQSTLLLSPLLPRSGHFTSLRSDRRSRPEAHPRHQLRGFRM